MARAISYFVFSSTGSYLRWDDDPTIGFTIHTYQMSITGGSDVDRLYAGANTQVDATGLFASAGVDQLYLSGNFADYSGNFADYTQTVSSSGVYTFTGVAGGAHAGEVLSFSMTSSGDQLVFADRMGVVQLSTYLNIQTNSFAFIQSSQLTAGVQPNPASGAVPGNAASKVFVFDSGGINIPQLPIAGEAVAITGGSGVDSFYVRRGTHADATGLFASAGIDALYLTGKFADYTQTVSTGGVYTFTRHFMAPADVGLSEVVSFSLTSSGDKLVFADGGATLQLSHYLSGSSFSMILAADLSPSMITPGLVNTPSLSLASDTGASASDSLTNNPTINVTGLGTGTTWQYQVDGTAGSWVPGSGNNSFTASSGGHSYFVRQIDATGNTSPVSAAVTYILDTSAPSGIASMGTSGNVAENTTGAVTLTANANDVAANASVTWSLGATTGANNDTGLFNLTNGVLSFKTPPSFETPRGTTFNSGTNNNNYTVNVVATDLAGNASTRAITVTVQDVNENPVLSTPIPDQTININRTINIDVASAFSDPDILDKGPSSNHWGEFTSYTATGLPSGLTLSNAGVISGTVTTTQNAMPITITATDGGGLSVTEIFTLTVVNAPVLSNFSVSDNSGNTSFGKSGDTLTFLVKMSEAVTVNTTGGTPTITFSINGQSVTASHTGGVGNDTLIFTATAPAAGNGNDIRVSAIDLHGATVVGSSDNLAWLTTSVGQTYSGYTVDNTAPATPSLSLASDTGSSASDRITNNPTINVNALEAGATWKYQVDGTAGSWEPGSGNSFTATSGAHSYFVQQTDLAGNTSAISTVVTYTLDNSVPTAPTLSLASDTGSSASDRITNNPTILVTSLEAGASWKYQVDGTGGTWLTGTGNSFIASSGGHSYFVQQTDVAGNTSPISTAIAYTLDTTLPATLTLALASDTGASRSDNITNNPTINVNALEAGATWQYQVDGTAAGSWVPGTGNSFTASSGAHSYFVRQIDTAGNTGAASTTATYTLDTSAPDAPTLALASDTGVSDSDRITSNPTILVSGLEVGASWQYQVDGSGAWTSAIASGTSASFTASSGAHSYTVQQTDLAGNTSNPSASVTYTLLNAVTPGLSLASDTGANHSDGITSNPTINVTALATGGSWQYQVDGTAGTWTIGTGTSFIASNGAHSYFVQQTDVAGSTSRVSAPFTYTLDTSAPDAPTLALFNDTGASAIDGITANATIVVSGLESGATWQYQVDGTAAGSWMTGSGNSFTASTGAHSYFVRQTDLAGNTSQPSLAGSYTVVGAPVVHLQGTSSSYIQNASTQPIVLLNGSNTLNYGRADYNGFISQSVFSGATLEMWANITNLSASTLASLTGSLGIFSMNWQLKADGTLSVRDNLRSYDFGTVVQNSWQHYALTMQPSAGVANVVTVTVYINGRQQGSSQLIGMGPDYYTQIVGNGLNAQVSDVRIYTSARDATTIANDYAGSGASANFAGATPVYFLSKQYGSSAGSAVNLTAGDSITSVGVAISGGTAAASEKLQVVSGTSTVLSVVIDASGRSSSGTFRLGSDSWDWVYDAASLRFTFTLSNNAAHPTSAQTQALLNALAYSNSAPTNTERSFTITVQDIAGNNGTAVARIDFVALAPTLSLASDTGVSNADRITNNATINVQGLEAGASWQYQVDTSAWITGTGASFTATSGMHSYFVQQTDAAGNISPVSAASTYTLDTSAPSAIASMGTSANVAENSLGAVTLTANANDLAANASVTWSLGTGADTALFNLTSGVLSFKNAPNYEMPRGLAPSASNTNTYTVNVIATDVAGNASTQAISVTVQDVNDRPVTNGVVRDQLLNRNVSYSLDVTGYFSDPDRGNSYAMGSPQWGTLTYSATGLPTGISLDSATGSISGTATSLGVQEVTVTATDGGGLSATQVFFIEVLGAPFITGFSIMDGTASNGTQRGRSGEVLTFTVTVSEAVSDIDNASQIIFSLNSVDVTATYQTGQGNSTLFFTASVPAGNSGNNYASGNHANIKNLNSTDLRSAGVNLASNIVGQFYTDYTVDNIALAPSLSLATDSGLSAVDGITNNATINVNGLEAGASWQYKVDTSAWVTGTGSSFTATSGAHSYTVQQTDLAGNTSRESATVSYTVDTAVPAALTVRLASDTGGNANDGITNNPTIIVSGLQDYAAWRYQVDGGAWLNGTGNTFNASVGQHNYSVQQVSLAGQVSATTGPQSYFVVSAPSIYAASSLTTPENSVFSSNVGLSALPNSGTVLTLGSGADSALFSLSNQNGTYELRRVGNALFNYEMPRGMPVSASNGNIYTVNFNISDNAGNNVTQSLAVTVTDVNDAPIAVGSVPSQTAAQNAGYSFNVTSFFSDPDRVNTYPKRTPTGALTPQWGTLTYTASGLPNGLSMSYGVISGTATATTASAATVTVTATDFGGLSTTQTFSLSVVFAPVMRSFTVTDSVGSANFGKSGDTLTFTVNMSETVTVGGTPQITFNMNGQSVTASYASGSGSSTLIFTATAPSGDGNNISITSINLNSGTVTGSVSGAWATNAAVGQIYRGYTLDNTVSTPSLSLANDTGANASDGITNNAIINVFGLESGATWQYQVDTSTWQTGTGASFTASIGAHSYSVQQVDLVGNTSTASNSVLYTLDQTPPALLSLSLASDTGSSASDGATKNPTIRVGGLESNATWQYQVDNSGWLNGTGSSFIASSGLHLYQIQQTDLAGNTGPNNFYNFGVALSTSPVGTPASISHIQLSAGNTGMVNNVLPVGTVVTALVYMTDVITIGGTPQLALTIGNHTVNASFSQTATQSLLPLLYSSYTVSPVNFGDILLFTYTIQASDGVGAISIPAGSLNLNGGTINNTETNTIAANLSVSAVPDYAGYWVNANRVVLSTNLNATTGFSFTGTTKGVIHESNDLSRSHGSAIANAGDVNGDGYDDFLFSEPEANGTAGAVYVIFGGSNGVSLRANTLGAAGFVINGAASGDYSGFSVAGAGDINGDGLSDILIGAPQFSQNYHYFDNGVINTLINDPFNGRIGKSYVIFGKRNTSAVNLSAVEQGSSSAGFVLTGALQNNAGSQDTNGFNVSAAGDVNGDGFADFIVAAPLAHYIPPVVYEGGVIVGAANGNGQPTGVGASYVVFGKADWSGVSALNVNDIANGNGGFVIQRNFGSNASFIDGMSVSSLGDINGDGLADMLVATPFDGGKNYVVFGKTSTATVNLSAVALGTGGFAFTFPSVTTVGTQITYPNPTASEFAQVASAGDVNGDGLADFAISSSAYPGVQIVFGKNNWANGYTPNSTGNAGFTILGDVNGRAGGVVNYVFNYSVSTAGDFNGDGLADLLIGVSFAAGGNGRTYLVYGKSDPTNITFAQLEQGIGGFAISSNTSSQNGLSVSGGADINGDGFADLLISAPMNTTVSTQVEFTINNMPYHYSANSTVSNATGYVIFGGPSYSSGLLVQATGGAMSTATGGSANEMLVGTNGNDTLTGGGGVDRFFGGAGNDIIVLSSYDIYYLENAATVEGVYATVDGGHGIDTIRLTGGANLDLTTIANITAGNPLIHSRIASIERIDLRTDTAANRLTLGISDVLDMAGMNSFNTDNGWRNAGGGSAFNSTVQKHQLVIDGLGSGATPDVVHLNGVWTQSKTGANVATSNFDTVTGTGGDGTTHTYTVYNSATGNAQVLIDASITPVLNP